MAAGSPRGYPRCMNKTRQKIRRGLLIASLLLLPVTLYYFSPALSLQGATAGVASGSVLVFAGLFVSALFLGRAFCGWACPMGGLQELTARLRGRPVARRRLAAVFFVPALLVGRRLHPRLPAAGDPLFIQ